ncbi:hypothetical protein ACLOJK_012461 [Asimina triloba]
MILSIVIWTCSKCFFYVIASFGSVNVIVLLKDWERQKLLGSFNSTGLIISSKLPRFSDMYTLIVASSDPKSISANKPVQFTKSVTNWFTRDGVLVEGLFWKDVDKLIDDYAGDSRKNK